MNPTDRRWEQGVPHHEVSVRIIQTVREIDQNLAADLKMGGDGDNGETIAYLLDEAIDQTGCCPGCGCNLKDKHKDQYTVEGGKRYAVVRVEITDEDRRAGNFDFRPHVPDDRMSISDMVAFHLNGAVTRRLHILKSKMKWDEQKIYASPNLREEQGYQRTVEVIRPVEGSWECEGSPTGVCWYCDQNDPCWDGCLFCGGPHERK